MKISSLEKYLKIESSQYDDAALHGAAVDSRLVKPGMIFFAVKGENLDGNSYAQSALDAGAAVAVMDNKAAYDKVNGNKILVENVLKSIYRMARLRAKDIKAVKIAITGSFGKTSTKEMVKLVLSEQFKTQATEGNYNNMLGVSLTVCGISDDTEIAIFEMGTNSIGEISALSELIEPNIAILTGYGYAHIGKFRGLAQVVHEKLSVTDHMTGRGLVIAQENFARGLTLKDKSIVKEVISYGVNPASDFYYDSVSLEGRTLEFSVHSEGESWRGAINYPYIHLVENLLAVFALAKELGMSKSQVTEIVKNYEVVPGRGSIIELPDITIVDDTYNASLDAIVKSIDNLSRFEKAKYALIGEVMEIDGHEDRIYSEIVSKAAEYPDINFIFSGLAYVPYRDKGNYTVVVSESETKAALDQIKGGIILIKASHGCHFEQYVSYVAGRFGGQDAL